MPRVLHDDGRGTRIGALAKALGAVAAQPRRHAGAGRPSPQGVAVHGHAQLALVLVDEGDGTGEVLTGRLRTRTIDEREGVVALARER